MREIHDVMSQTKILLLHVQVLPSLLLEVLSSRQLIRQTKTNSEWFSCYKYIILETCGLNQQPCAEMLSKGHTKMPVRSLWCNYATFTNFTFQLPKFFAAHSSGAQDSVRGYDWQNATWHEWLSKTGEVFLSNKDCCIPDQMAAQEC